MSSTDAALSQLDERQLDQAKYRKYGGDVQKGADVHCDLALCVSVFKVVCSLGILLDSSSHLEIQIASHQKLLLS